MNRQQRRGERSKSPAAALLAEAHAHHRAGRIDQAIEGYRKVIAAAPNSVDAIMNLANALTARGFRDEAVDLFRRAAKLLPRSAEVHHDFGVALLEFGLHDEAIAAFERAIAIAPGAAPPFAKLGEALLEIGERERAVAALQQSIARDPLAARTYYELYRAVYDTRDLRPAIDAITKAVANDPDFVIARFWLAVAMDQKGDHKAAAQLLDNLHPDKSVLRGAVESWRYVKRVMTPATRFVTTVREGLLHAIAHAPAEGLIVELGVRYGISTRWLAQSGSGATVHGFDSFEGLPEQWHIQPAGIYSTHGATPRLPDNVRLHVGLFGDTLPPFVAGERGALRLLHVDCDLYSSTREGFVHLAPRVVPGTVIVFDEYLVNDRYAEDEFKAFHEAAAEHGWKHEYLAFNLCTGQTVVRITAIR